MHFSIFTFCRITVLFWRHFSSQLLSVYSEIYLAYQCWCGILKTMKSGTDSNRFNDGNKNCTCIRRLNLEGIEMDFTPKEFTVRFEVTTSITVNVIP